MKQETNGASRTCTRRLPGLLVLAVLATPAGASGHKTENWQLVPIPDTWKSPPKGAEEGFAWYRCLVKVPAEWQGKDLNLFVESVDDAREVRINGTKVGAAGTFPPLYRSGLGEPGRYVVPARLVQFGKTNLLAVRVYHSYGRSNFKVSAPAIWVGNQAVKMEGDWQFRFGDDSAWGEKWGDAKTDKVLYSTVDRVTDLENYLRRRAGDNDPYPPAEALVRMTVANDLVVEQPLAEPVVRQPLHMSFDGRGRLWVVQYLQYPNPAGLKPISRDKFLRTVFDKVPPPPPHHFKGADRITIHEDSDGDGVFDRHKTFVDGLSICTSAARGRGGVWVLNPPYLLFYPDRNRDDRPDGDPEVHLEGFGLEDTHSVANNLRWGPDGWLYGAQGSTVTGNIRRPGAKEVVHSMGQLIWRYHPETRRYEIFAEGGGNTQGIELDAKGRIFSGHNGGDTRGFHYVQGGYYLKGFAKHGALSNPYTFGYFPAMAHNQVPRFSHTFIIYEENTLPPTYRGKLFGVEPLQSRVVLADVQRDRSSFQTRDLGHPLVGNDQWFRPVNIAVGPDGAVYVADMYEQYIDHSSHYAGRVDVATGRIYRLRARGPYRPESFDYRKMSTAQLIERLGHASRWHRQMAVEEFADRKDASANGPLRQVLQTQTGAKALGALWALSASGGLTDETALECLRHADPHVRLWTVRLLCDARKVADSIAHRLAELAATDIDVEVRSQLACSARRLPAAQCLPIVRNLAARSEDASDIHVPLLVWWALESKTDSDRAEVLALFQAKEFWNLPLVQRQLAENTMRRFAAAGTRTDLLACARLLSLAPDAASSKRLLAGFEQAYAGRSLQAAPAELLDALAKTGGGSLYLRLRQNQAEAVAEALRRIADEKTPKAERTRLIEIFGQIRQPACIAPLLKLVESHRDDQLRCAALVALQSYEDSRIAAEVVRLVPQLPADPAGVALNVLASRQAWALVLLGAVDAGSIRRDTVPMAVVRRTLHFNYPPVQDLVRKHWGQVEGIDVTQLQKQIDHYTKVLDGAAGNPYKGKRLFLEHCGKCHTLFGQGGAVGPDLTSYQRDDVRRMLMNTVNPSAEIREGFENYLILTTDGRALGGFLADQDKQVVVLRTAEGQNLVIPRDEIEEMRAVERSVMPDDALTQLSDQQVRDLFAYLRSSQPLSD